MGDGVLRVMVSSTFRDLIPERQAARDAILGLGMQPLMMETDSAAPDRGLLTGSFAMVDKADIYVLLVSNYRYGQIIAEPELNPKDLSITELEFERALARGTDHCKVCAYLMDDAVPPPSVGAVRAEVAADRLEAFRARARDPSRSSADFVNPHDLKQKITQTLAEIRAGQGSGRIAEPAGTAPPVPDRCVGRDPDLARIVAALTSPSHPNGVLLQGPGGIGKTTITQQAAHDPAVLVRFGRRIWFVALETATDRDTFDAALVLALGLEPIRGFAAAEQVLSQGPTLLVLDNLETPWEAAGPAVEARLGALSAIPGVVLLASFRGQDAVGGARWTLRHRVNPLPEPEARLLFLDIAETIPDSDLDLPSLLRDLGGVPLAICLTARRALGRSNLASLWAEWKRIGTEFSIWRGSEPGRLTSVPHSIALSLQSSRMGPDGHRLFALLGQCPAGLAEADRAALLGDSAFAAAESLMRVGLAYEKDGRLDLLPPVRDYAKRQCLPGDAGATAWCRHFLDRARTEGGRIFRDGGAKALVDLTPEIANIDAALRAAPGLSLLPAAVGALDGVARLLSASGAGSPAVLDVLAYACLNAEDIAGRAACLFYHGEIAAHRSDPEGARARYEQALPLYRQVGDVLGEAHCVRSLGDIALSRSDNKGARARYEQALPLFRQVLSVQGEANCIACLGGVAFDRSDYEGARALYEQALPLFRQVEVVNGEANCVQRLGDIALSHSDHEGARARYEQALLVFRRVGSVQGEANCVANLGRIALSRSDQEGAQARYEQALPLFRQVGDALGEANCATGFGDIALSRSDHEGARERFEQALPLFRQVGSLQGEVGCIFHLGQIALDRWEHEGAQARFEQALPLYGHIGEVQGQANCVACLADIAFRRSDHEVARARYEQAVPLYRKVGSVQGEANCVMGLGDIALSRSDHEGARARFEQALSLYCQVGSLQGEANCFVGLGEIALSHSDLESARARFEHALPLYRQVGALLGEANCVAGQGRVARAMGNTEAALAHAEAALALYKQIHATQSIAIAHEDLARVTEGAEREGHVEAARAAWLSMDLPDQAERVTREFG